LVKLIRKGFKPVELPVNYRSRSFKEGKKVRVFKDPLSWLGTIVWLRFVRMNPMEVVARMKNAPEPAPQVFSPDSAVSVPTRPGSSVPPSQT